MAARCAVYRHSLTYTTPYRQDKVGMQVDVDQRHSHTNGFGFFVEIILSNFFFICMHTNRVRNYSNVLAKYIFYKRITLMFHLQTNTNTCGNGIIIFRINEVYAICVCE